MCLSKVLETYDAPSTLILAGWKAFSGEPNRPRFKIQNFNGSALVPLDSWIRAENNHGKDLADSSGHPYKPGFHIWSDESQLKPLASYRRVYYRNVTCAGEQGGKKAIIAQEMYVPSDENGWPPQNTKSLADRIKGIKPGRA